jgi:2-polyprenyl-3-methyl-5-hydroxy-6-metoxy-1,4-benzoquinol methylase
MNKQQKIQDEEYIFPYHYISDHENGFSQSINWGFGLSYESFLEFLVQEISYCSGESIADIGSGDGRLVREISKKFPKKTVLGIDYSEKAINLAKAMNPGLTFFCADINSDKRLGKYDIITLIEVLEHIPIERIDNFVEALRGKLKEGGYLFITVPHKNKSLQSKHFQHFSFRSLTHYFDDYFNLEKKVFFEKRSFLAAIIQKILANNIFILNSSILKYFLYNIYKKKCFRAQEKDCGRIFLKLRKK